MLTPLKTMPPAGKTRPFLRSINALLRSLSRTPEDVVLRGRVHQLVSDVLRIAEPSGVNLMGTFAALSTEYDTFEHEDENGIQGEAVPEAAGVVTGHGEEEGDAQGEGNGSAARAGADVEMETEGDAAESAAKGKGKANGNSKSGAGDQEQEKGTTERADQGEASNKPDAVGGVKTGADVEAGIEKSRATTSAADASPSSDPRSGSSVDRTFYTTLWSLQAYLSNPALLCGPAVNVQVPVGDADADAVAGKSKTVEKLETPLETLRRKADTVLAVLYEQTAKEQAVAAAEAARLSNPATRADGARRKDEGRDRVSTTTRADESSSSSRKRKRDDAAASTPARTHGSSTPLPLPGAAADRAGPGFGPGTALESTYFHPRYLTSAHLLPYSLSDVAFRRQVLVQFFILFQFLRSLGPDNKYTVYKPEERKSAPLGGVPRKFSIPDEYGEWLSGAMTKIVGELGRMDGEAGPGAGRAWAGKAKAVLDREHRYVSRQDWLGLAGNGVSGAQKHMGWVG